MIAVIGAGPAGLAVAWRLGEAGHDVVVLEAADRVGGMAASVEVSGVCVDLGSHRLHPAMPAPIRRAVDDLVELQERPRNGRIRLGDRWLPFPLTPVGLARGLPAATAARAVRDALAAPARRPRDDSYAEVLRAGLGPTVWRRFHEPYAWKLWGTDPNRLAGELARRRVSAATPADVARRVVRGVRTRPTFLYPRRGFGALVEAMADRVPEIRLGTKVTGLIEHGDRVIVGLADGRIVTASHVFSTVPATRTAGWLQLLDPQPPLPAVRAMVLVYLTLDRRPYTEFDAHYLPERGVLPTRVSEPTNYRTDPADPPDRTVLCAELPCWEGDDTWGATDADLGLRVADDLVRSGLPAPHVVAVHTVRLPSVYPVMTPEALAAVDRAEQALAASRRVTVLGRQGLFTPDNTHHVLDMGFAAASCVTDDGELDRARWDAERDRFRTFVVED